jgi:F-type H+-transporting ATPase subunit delta
MASVVGTYARAFADVVMATPTHVGTDAFVRPAEPSEASAHSHLDPAPALQELHNIEALLKESDQLRRVLENPSIPGDRKRAVLNAITTRLGTTRQVRNFVAVLTDHRRLPLFSEILKQLEHELDDRQGFAEAQISTARQLADEEKQLLEAEITKLIGKRVKAKYAQDSTLLGGAVVQVGSTIYDGSVKGQLEQIGEQLVEA